MEHDYEQYNRPPRITNEARETHKLLILLAVENNVDFTSNLSTKSGLSTRQVNRLLRKSGRVNVTRRRDTHLGGNNDYRCRLTSTPKIVLEWPPVPVRNTSDDFWSPLREGSNHAFTGN